MGQGGLATQLWYARPVVRRAIIIVLVILVGFVSWQSIAVRAPGMTVAPWWPAAGLAFVAILASRGSRGLVTFAVFLSTGAANLFSGRELAIAIGFGLANALEAYVVAQLASRGGPEARLDSFRDVGRFILATISGAATAGVFGGATALLVLQDDFFVTFGTIVASHGSAMLVVAPVALVSRRIVRGPSRIEVVLQLSLLVALLTIVFWPGFTLPLAFAPLTAVLWAAFRFPMMVVGVELLLVGAIAATLTSFGGGPFGVYVADDPRLASVLLQLFLVVHACAALFVAAARSDWANVVTQLGAREALLRGGIVNSETGILIAEILDGDRLRVVGVNTTALSALGRELMPPTWGVVGLRIAQGQPIFGVDTLDEAILTRVAQKFELDREGRRYDVDLGLHEGAGGATVMTLVFTDVTTRDERERRALDAAERLRDLNRQKDDFIASVSHELRTPVTSILGFVEDLEGAELGPDERVATEVISRNARRLADVIEDVLELGKLSSSNAVSRPSSEFDLVALARHCAQDAEGLALGRSVRLVVTAVAEPLPIRSVSQDLTRVLANLLSNAVKFTPDGGQVDVEVATTVEGAVISITDHGPGIPPAVLDQVWDRFYRVSDAEHRDVPGTGLGLPIVRALVEQRLAGSVELLSDGRTGTTARVELPWDRDLAVARRAAEQTARPGPSPATPSSGAAEDEPLEVTGHA